MSGLLVRMTAVVFVTCGSVAAWAQEPASELDELRARVAALEQQNAELEEAVLRRLPPAADSGDSARYTQAAFPSDPTTFDSDVRTAVDQYLAEKETFAAEEKKLAAEAGGEDLAMTAKWNHGLELSTDDKRFRVHVGGRTQFDTSWFSVERNVNTPAYLPGGVIYEDGVDFRRARIRIDGTMYETIDWAVEYDFANALRIPVATPIDQDVTAFTDVWWTFKEVPVLGNVRVGNQKEQIGFEHLVSSRFLPFLERSYNQDAFYGGTFNGFTPGVQAFNNWNEEMGLWAIGLFKPVDNVYAAGAWDGDRAVTGRLTHLLWYCDEGDHLLHVGVGSRWFSSTRDRHRFRTRDAVRSGAGTLWPVIADSTPLLGDDGTWIDGELAAVFGPWTFQSEYLLSYFSDAQRTQGSVPVGPLVDSLFYHGGYVQLFYFLTGEHDNYNRKTAVFDRVIPAENCCLVPTPCGPAWGCGAWQIGARYDYLDLNNQGIDGGMLHNLTAGLNWFLNPNLKIQFNYIATYRDAEGVLIPGATPLVLTGDQGTGWIHGFGIRVAHDF